MMAAPQNDSEVRPVFLIGAQKAGTTFLHNALVSTGGIRPTMEKETHYFSTDRHRTVRWEELFDNHFTGPICLDGSVSYLHVPGTQEKIKARFENAIIIATIRDPAQRAISAFLHNAKNGRDLRGLSDALDIRATTSEEIFEEEDFKIRKALDRGSIILRPAYEHHFGDKFYDDPFWTFRYTFNSQFDFQLGSYFQNFSVLLFDFRDLVTFPLVCVNAIRLKIGLQEANRIDENSEANTTRISNARVVRKFLRNYAYSKSDRPTALKMSYPLLRSLFRDYNLSNRAADFKDTPWYISAGYDDLVRTKCEKKVDDRTAS